MSKNLSAFGFDDRYTINKTGIITDNQKSRICKSDRKNIYHLLTKKGKRQKISLKKIYRLAFGIEYCIDEIETEDGEKWKNLSVDDRYSVSNYGRIKSRCGYAAKILNPYKTPNGYLKVDIKGKGYFIHRLVYEAFTGETAETIHHKDKGKQNNSLVNLQGLTRVEHAKLTYQERKQKKEDIEQ